MSSNNKKAVRKMSRATGEDVARLAGVSKSTVSRIFNGGVVSPVAREKILAAAKTLHYRPNPTARSLTIKRSFLVGVAITQLDNQFYPDFVQLLSDKLASQGYRIVLFVTHGERGDDPTLEEILNYSLDAIIFASSRSATTTAAACAEAGIPTIMFNSVDPVENCKCISTDDIDGAEQIAVALYEAGHRFIGVLKGLEESVITRRRVSAFANKICELGGAKVVGENCNFQFESAKLATRRLLTRFPDTDAIFALNDHMALACMEVCRNEFQLKPGEDISIIGFDDVTISGWGTFSLASFAHPLGQITDEIVNYVLASQRAEQPDTSPVYFKGELRYRSSLKSPS